jgi:NAD(P)-dependent dehydrogenase (short-subunit alcohol dehydrogenase family)
MAEQPLAGKIALITGGGRGIGAAISRRLAQLGATAVVCGRTQGHIDETAAQIKAAGGQSQAIACDVSDWNSVAALANRVKEAFGRLDILVNNAGIGAPGSPLHQLPPDKWDAILNTNLRGVFYMIRAFVPM